MSGELGIGECLFVNLSVVNKNLGYAFDEPFRLLAGKSDLPCDPVGSHQRDRQNDPACHGVVTSVHRVLHGVAEDEKQHQIERTHLANLPLACRAQDHDQESIDDDAASHEFPPGETDIPHHTELA